MSVVKTNIPYGTTLSGVLQKVYEEASGNGGSLIGQPIEGYTMEEINSNPLYEIHLELMFDSGVKVEAESFLDFVRVLTNAVTTGERLSNPQQTINGCIPPIGLYGPWFYQTQVIIPPTVLPEHL